jgi:hypothetical protein
LETQIYLKLLMVGDQRLEVRCLLPNNSLEATRDAAEESTEVVSSGCWKSG